MSKNMSDRERNPLGFPVTRNAEGTGIDSVDSLLSSFSTGYLGIEIPASLGE